MSTAGEVPAVRGSTRGCRTADRCRRCAARRPRRGSASAVGALALQRRATRCAASTGRSPTLNSATRARVHAPAVVERRPRAATPASAKSPCRASNLVERACRCAAGARRNLDLGESSPGSSAVENRPVKNSAAGISASPLRASRRVIVASSASITAGSSAAGSACARLPPIVPRVRIAACATNGIVCGEERRASRRRPRCARRARCRVIAPMRRPPSPSRDVGELGNAIEIDQHRRRGEPEVHRRNQALAAGERLGVGAVLGQQRQRLVQRSADRGTRTAPAS